MARMLFPPEVPVSIPISSGLFSPKGSFLIVLCLCHPLVDWNNAEFVTVWRRHRKLTSPAFAEANNRLVWETTLQCTKAMTTSWIQSNELGQRNIQQLRDAAMDLSLEVIGIAALGQNVGWVKDDSERSDRTLPGGHTMAFAASLKHVCANIVPIVRLLSPFVRFIKCMTSLFSFGLQMLTCVQSFFLSRLQIGETSRLTKTGVTT